MHVDQRSASPVRDQRTLGEWRRGSQVPMRAAVPCRGRCGRQGCRKGVRRRLGRGRRGAGRWRSRAGCWTGRTGDAKRPRILSFRKPRSHASPCSATPANLVPAPSEAIPPPPPGGTWQRCSGRDSGRRERCGARQGTHWWLPFAETALASRPGVVPPACPGPRDTARRCWSSDRCVAPGRAAVRRVGGTRGVRTRGSPCRWG